MTASISSKHFLPISCNRLSKHLSQDTDGGPCCKKEALRSAVSLPQTIIPFWLIVINCLRHTLTWLWYLTEASILYEQTPSRPIP